MIVPSASTSMRSAAGRSGRPGIRTMSPVRATRNPAPAAISTSRTVQREAPGPAAELGVVGERVLGLGHADRQLAVAELGGLAELGCGRRQDRDAVGAVHDPGDLLDLPLGRPVQRDRAA